MKSFINIFNCHLHPTYVECIKAASDHLMEGVINNKDFQNNDIETNSVTDDQAKATDDNVLRNYLHSKLSDSMSPP
jgi:hypothetical protein